MEMYESIPEANLLLESLRSVGYSVESAVADIVDNSISAGAKKIFITFDWENKSICIVDDGQGMERSELYDNMKIGSSNPNQVRDSKDLGRFGMGMKTAAFSIGRKLTVVTTKDGKASNASWDLDLVDELGWNLIINEESHYSDYLLRLSKDGTAIIISNLDKLIDKNSLEKSKRNFFNIIKKLKEHLSLVFHRFISDDGLQLFVNEEEPLVAWDPFVTKNKATQELAEEEIWDPTNKIVAKIQPYVLPHKTKFDSEADMENAKGKSWTRNQGIYLYRNKRLIVYGTWFDIIKKEQTYVLARDKVDILSEADFDWNIDIKKSSASLPVYLRERMISIIDDCTQKSTNVFNSRGAYSKREAKNNALDIVWEQSKRNGQYYYRINKKHPILNKVLEQLTSEGKESLKGYLSLIENFVPFMRNGISDTMNNKEPKVDILHKQQDIAEIESIVCSLKQCEMKKNEILDFMNQCSMYYYLKNEMEEIVEGFYDKH